MRDFHLPGRSTVFATEGMCATSHPVAAHTAIRILQDGGNAVDAAIAAGVLLGIAEPQMTGLGGDLFVLMTPPGENRILALNASGRAPAALRAETLRAAGHSSVPLNGAEAVTLPGAVAGFCKLSEEWGRLDLDQTLSPAIHYAEHGLPVAPRTAFDWAGFADLADGYARTHFLIDGTAPRPGHVFRAPGQAEVLRRIAAQGRAGFYEGEVAAEMVATLRERGGVHTETDFAEVEADWVNPISGDYKGMELVEHPPNGQGATAILLAKILARFDLPALDPFGAVRAHLEAEATKLAYDARDRFLADADHTNRLAHMTDDATADALAALIDPKRAMPTPPPAAGAVHKETVTLSVVDKDRMVVSMIYSIFHDFGSGIATPNFGLLFHNRGAGFCLEPGHPNEIGGGKRPMHTIIPGMLRDAGRVSMPFGVMGGAYQATGHARFLTNTVDYELHPQAALDAPRSFATEGELRVERGYSETVCAELAEMGHKVVIPEVPIGGAQAIRVHADGVLEGASDARKDGCALGY
ncbi:MAG: gamma-glutamyltransferase family protein [Rhodobacteraceae bacterium]|nr:gamma-glutamyltransferase family protein [Paracoccaceae bacterium]